MNYEISLVERLRESPANPLHRDAIAVIQGQAAEIELLKEDVAALEAQLSKPQKCEGCNGKGGGFGGTTTWNWCEACNGEGKRPTDAQPARNTALEQAILALEGITELVDGTGFASSTEFDACLDAIDIARAILQAAQPVAKPCVETYDIPKGYALVSKEALRAWGKYDEVSDACVYVVDPTAAQPVSEQEPDAWMWQHEETGRVGFIDHWQLENGFEKANPRLKIIKPLFAAPPVSSKDSQDAARYRHLRNQHDPALWDAYDAAIDAAIGVQEGKQ